MNEALDIAIELIKRFEGCKLKAYKCPAGIWTIGWGETLGVKEGDVWTQEHADAVLRQRTVQFMQAVLRRCPVLHTLPAGMLAACTDMAYNIGIGAFAASSVCRKTKQQDFDGAAQSFLLWNKAGGKVLRGLTIRCHARRLVYLCEQS